MSEQLFDPGLQPERTILAWRRTCLAFVVAGTVVMRFTVEQVGMPAVVVGLAIAGLAAAAYFLASHRYRRVRLALTAAKEPPAAGIPVALACAATLLLGAASAAHLVMGIS